MLVALLHVLSSHTEQTCMLIFDGAPQFWSSGKFKMFCKWNCVVNLKLADLTWLVRSVYCGYNLFLILQASCLPTPCQCLSVDYTLSACLHVALQLLLRLLAEQAPFMDGHSSANEETWVKKGFRSNTVFLFFNILVLLQISSIVSNLFF